MITVINLAILTPDFQTANVTRIGPQDSRLVLSITFSVPQHARQVAHACGRKVHSLSIIELISSCSAIVMSPLLRILSQLDLPTIVKFLGSFISKNSPVS